MNYQTLTQYGNFIELDVTTNAEQLVSWAGTFDWVKYNPRKDVNRWGLSITSLDGGLSGVPDLDSLYEYCLLYTSPSPRDATLSRMPSSA